MTEWKTAWVRGTGQEKEMTWIYDNLHISSLDVARNADLHNIYYTINMCDESNYQKQQSHFPVGEITSFYGEHESQQKDNWKSAVRHAVRMLKTDIPFTVHCYAGIHRSTLVSSAALTLAFPEKFPTLESAHEHTLTRRIIGWKKEDTFKMMKVIVESMRKETFTPFDEHNDLIPTQSESKIVFNRVSLF